jgi:hypothetical protein
MTAIPRHQCLIYDGAPSRHLPMLAAILRRKLQLNFRCLYVNSEDMVAALGSHLAAAGVDVAEAFAKRSLVLSSDRPYLIDGRTFDVDRMLGFLREALDGALQDGFAGLWATGDMTWEMGPKKDFSKLLEYEWRLEEFFREHPEFGCVCQYHAGTLPRDAVQQGMLVHRELFISETLSRLNPEYLDRAHFPTNQSAYPDVERVLRLFDSEATH